VDPTFAAFTDELEKIAAAKLFSRQRMKEFAARMAGRHRALVRPRKATTTVAKPKLKYKLSEYTPATAGAIMNDGSTQQELVAKKPRLKSDVPSRESMDTGPNRMDGRDNATTIYAPGSQLTGIGATTSNT
jgi:hypothetical protein